MKRLTGKDNPLVDQLHFLQAMKDLLGGSLVSAALLLRFTGKTAMLATELGVQGTQCTLNNKPTFLFGISYYGALGAPEVFIERDLADMQRHGVNWIRVWATWSAFGSDVSAVDGEGRAREPFLFISPHRPREAGSPAQTEARSREYLAWMKEIGQVVPLHYQEPFRRGYGRWQPRSEDFLMDLRSALTGGAAGWCLHNGDERNKPHGRPRRSFNLREKRLFEQMDEEERKALAELGLSCL